MTHTKPEEGEVRTDIHGAKWMWFMGGWIPVIDDIEPIKEH